MTGPGRRPHVPPPQDRPRLAGLLAALSLVTDLARGQPPEQAMRACLFAMRLAELLGIDAAERPAVFYASLLRSVGCTATSHEYARVFGDDVEVRRLGDLADTSRTVNGIRLILATTPRRGTVPARAGHVVAALRDARPVVADGSRADCEVGASMARRFGLPSSVADALGHAWDRWDGRGSPGGSRGASIPVASRVSAVAAAAALLVDAFGVRDGIRVLRSWSGRALDPGVVDALLRDPGMLDGAASAVDPLAAVLAAEPGHPRAVGPSELDGVARGFADVVDLKSPYFHGHSAGVARLAAESARLAGLGPDGQAALLRAGLLHDLGRAGVSTGAWERPGPLRAAEWEQVRLHAYHTERILSASPVLAPLARLAGLHHERLDGSGYHRGAPPSMLDMPARLLAAADVYTALCEPRPHRPARSAADAARVLEGMPLDRDAVAAVLEAAGLESTRRRANHPAGLTEREVEILRLVVAGLSERQIAERLVVSPSTVHTHVTHVYEKAGVSTRAAAAVFAMEHDLVRPPGTSGII